MPILGYQPIQKMTFLNTLTVDEIKGAMHFAIKYKPVVRNYLEKTGQCISSSFDFTSYEINGIWLEGLKNNYSNDKGRADPYKITGPTLSDGSCSAKPTHQRSMSVDA